MLPLVLVYLVTLFSYIEARQVPAFVKQCHKSVADQKACLLDSIHHMRPYLAKGIPEMGVPSMDPMSIPFLHLAGGGGENSFSYSINLTNMFFIGAKDFTIEDANVDLVNNNFKLTIRIPHFDIKGHYKVNGKMLVIEIQSDGDFTGELTDMVLNGTWHARIDKIKGKSHYVFDENKVAVDVHKFKAEFKDLFKENQQLTDNTNRLINENADMLFEEINPVISEGISQLVTAVLNKVHELFSIDELYPD